MSESCLHISTSHRAAEPVHYNSHPTCFAALCFTPLRESACHKVHGRCVTACQDTVSWLSARIKSSTVFISFTTLCFPILVAPRPVFDLFPLFCFLIELCLNLHVRFQSPQCCKRKLVAMLMSLFDALRASSASILEKPISTSRATCRGWWNQLRCLNNFPQGINEAT